MKTNVEAILETHLRLVFGCDELGCGQGSNYLNEYPLLELTSVAKDPSLGRNSNYFFALNSLTTESDLPDTNWEIIAEKYPLPLEPTHWRRVV